MLGISTTGQGQRLKIVLYSHDTQGLGHTRRNLSIATALMKADPRLSILLITGAREAAAFDLPRGVDCLTLPGLGKDARGQYQPRSLDISRPRLITLRADTIRAAIEAFAPDVLIVDKVPLGAFQELRPSLEWLQAQRHTRCILGLREILDDPETVRREWHLAGNDAAVRAYYDAVWVYGDSRVYDPVYEYGFSEEVVAKVRYTGYLDRRSNGETDAVDEVEAMAGDDPLATLNLPSGRLALCMVGGGQDGDLLADAFLRAALPPDTSGLVVTGPFMSAEARRRLERRAAAQPRRRVLAFVTQPEILLRRADRVVTMGGYNTACEILSFEKQALIVPRVKPRLEQLIRAERLARLGLVDYLHPADLTPEALALWLARDLPAPQGVRDRIDLNGLARLPELLLEALATPPQRGAAPAQAAYTLMPGYFTRSRQTIPSPHTLQEVHYVVN